MADAIGSFRHRPARHADDAPRLRFYVLHALLLPSTLAFAISQVASHGADMSMLFWSFVAARLIAEFAVVRVSESISFVMGDMYCVVAFIAFDLGTAVAYLLLTGVLCCGAVSRSWLTALMHVSYHIIVFGGSLVAVRLVLDLAPAGAAATTIAVAVGLGSIALVDTIAYPLTVWLAYGARSSMRDILGWGAIQTALASICIDFPATVAVALTFKSAPWLGPAFITPQLVLSFLSAKRFALTQQLIASLNRLGMANVQFTSALVHALDARDASTAGHSAAVAIYARDLAVAAGLDDATCHAAYLGGLLHDIGKIGVRGKVLNKQGPLSPEEFRLMMHHANIGADILADVDEFGALSEIVRHHHERWDGRGYPAGLAQEAIPQLSRIIAIADTYSSMTTDRPYRKGLDPEISIAELERGRDVQWDGHLVDLFVGIVRTADDHYRKGLHREFELEDARRHVTSDPMADLSTWADAA